MSCNGVNYAAVTAGARATTWPRSAKPPLLARPRAHLAPAMHQTKTHGADPEHCTLGRTHMRGRHTQPSPAPSLVLRAHAMPLPAPSPSATLRNGNTACSMQPTTRRLACVPATLSPPGSDTGTEFHDFPSDVARRVRTLPRQRHSGSCQIVSSSRSTSEEQRRCAPCDTGSAPPPQPAPETAQAAPPLRFGRELLPPPY